MPDYHSYSESELVTLLQDGDELAFENLYDRYKQPLFRKLLRLVKQQDIARELLQDTFLKLWEKRSSVKPEQGAGALLYWIARNKVTDIYRRAANDRKLLEQIALTATELYDPEIEKEQSAQTKFILQNALNILPPQRKKVFMLCKLEGKTYEEASIELGVSLSTIRDHMTKANKALQIHFSDRTIALLLVTSILLRH